jgi:flagellar hook-basal body complex protein FliE
MAPVVRFAVSYRALSDSALISCADPGVADALGVSVDEVDQRQIDHDTTVESIDVGHGEQLARVFLAAQVLGVSSRSPFGLLDQALPFRLQTTLLSLVHDPSSNSDDIFAARRATASVPVAELSTSVATGRVERRPAHEVKAVCAALDDVVRELASRRTGRTLTSTPPEVSEALSGLLDDLTEADGLPVPFAVSRTARVLAEAPDFLSDVMVPMSEAVFDLATSQPWDAAAGIFRSARRAIVAKTV